MTEFATHHPLITVLIVVLAFVPLDEAQCNLFNCVGKFAARRKDADK